MVDQLSSSRLCFTRRLTWLPRGREDPWSRATVTLGPLTIPKERMEPA